MNLRIDRDLPVPIGVQLRGLVEYGIACGELARGSRLPSVRDLARRLEVGPMTVSPVYKELKAAGLLAMRPGQGTFVAGSGAAESDRLCRVRPAIDRLIAEARSAGIGHHELAALLNARLLAATRRERTLRIVMIGLFAEATRDYAQALQARLGEGVLVEPELLEALEGPPSVRRSVADADLVLTFAHLRARVGGLLPETPVATVSFIPAERTRAALAALDSSARLCLVSLFPAFLPIMKVGVRRFAPHVAGIVAAALDTPDLDRLLGSADTVVYATGAEAVLARLAPGTRVVEYRHMPDPGDIDRTVRPLLARLRAIPPSDAAAAGSRPAEEEMPA
jgi:DNA-binding transcriptional regulator YhcF (GntR family)